MNGAQIVVNSRAGASEERAVRCVRARARRAGDAAVTREASPPFQISAEDAAADKKKKKFAESFF